MRVRPTSVTVIGWILVLTALSSIVQDIRSVVRPRKTVVTIASPVPKPIEQVISALGTLMNLVCGYFLLKGKNWARYTEIAWSLGMLTYGYFTSPLPWMLVFGVALECLMIYLLFRPRANLFFAAENADMPIANEMSKRQIASTFFYVMGGFWLTSSAMVALLTPEQIPVYMWLVVFPLIMFPGILILIGKLLSPNPNWIREIGIVLLVSAAGAVAFQIALAVFFSNAEFQKAFAPEKPAPELNAAAGAIAILAIAWCGGLLVWVGRGRNPVSATKRAR